MAKVVSVLFALILAGCASHVPDPTCKQWINERNFDDPKGPYIHSVCVLRIIPKERK